MALVHEPRSVVLALAVQVLPSIEVVHALLAIPRGNARLPAWVSLPRFTLRHATLPTWVSL